MILVLYFGFILLYVFHILKDTFHSLEPQNYYDLEFGEYYNQATTNVAFHSNETSEDKLSII